jgi:carboxylesterase type B
MVWFHGGGFVIGSASWPQYNPTKLAALANTEGRPTIILSVNYRVGIFGNMASHDLLEYAKSIGQEGAGNQGLRDQTTALKWVQKFIKGFGGDPDKVLIFGESAGSASCNMHMIAKPSQGLFKRAILESGTATMVSAFPLEVQDHFYQDVLKKFDITGSTAKERVEALRSLPLEKIFEKITQAHPSRATCDGYFLDFIPTFADVENSNPRLFPDWMDAVMFGCTKDDVSPFQKYLTPGLNFRCHSKAEGNANHHGYLP